MKVAIIDDAPMNVTLLRHLVRKLPDCESECFTDPVAALAWCLENEPDLIVVDYMMPELSGIELVERFRLRHADTPVVRLHAGIFSLQQRHTTRRPRRCGLTTTIQSPSRYHNPQT
jgi:putative two-component system response regulator